MPFVLSIKKFNAVVLEIALNTLNSPNEKIRKIYDESFILFVAKHVNEEMDLIPVNSEYSGQNKADDSTSEKADC